MENDFQATEAPTGLISRTMQMFRLHILRHAERHETTPALNVESLKSRLTKKSIVSLKKIFVSAQRKIVAANDGVRTLDAGQLWRCHFMCRISTPTFNFLQLWCRSK
jgi:hypothetical protein